MMCKALRYTAFNGMLSYCGTAALTTINPVAGLIAGSSYGFFTAITERADKTTSLALSILLGAGATKLLIPALLGEEITFKAALTLTGLAFAFQTILNTATIGATALGLACCFCCITFVDELN